MDAERAAGPPQTAVGVDRRRAALTLATIVAVPWLGAAAPAAGRVGAVERAEGEAYARLVNTRRLAPRSEVLLGDLVWTEALSRASLGLDGGSRIHLGPETRLTLDRFVVAAGGDLTLGSGALVFDRPDDLPKIDLEIRSVFGLIGVRGTRFFAGPSSGVFGVFVARGEVRVAAAGVTRRLRAGDGVDIPRRGGPPSDVARWGRARVDAAFSGVLG